MWDIAHLTYAVPPPLTVVNVYSYIPSTTLSPTGEYSYFSRSRKDRHKEPVCLIPNDSVQALGGQIELLCGEAGSVYPPMMLWTQGS